MTLVNFFRRIGLFRPFNENQIADAETENVMRDHSIAVTRAESSIVDIHLSQVKLQESIQCVVATSETAERRHDPIAQFVHDMRSSSPHTTRRN